MIGPALAGLGSGGAGQRDVNGHFFRFPVSAGSAPFYLPCNIYLNEPTMKGELLKCQSLQDDLKALAGYRPLAPTPGTAPPPPSRSKR
jgi:hypothetical protein